MELTAMAERAYTHALDVLKRFAPAPIERLLFVAGMRVSMQTNDERLFPEFTRQAVRRGDPAISWRVVRDYGTQGELAAAVELESDEVVAIFLGTGCVIAADRNCGEIVSFMSETVCEREYREMIWPLLERLTLACGSRETPQSEMELHAPAGRV